LTTPDSRGTPGGSRVETTRLSRRFGDLVALDELTLTIERGETFGLLGANGAGKTTFIRLVTGFLAPSAGSVRVDSLSPIDHAADVHGRLGYVPETSRLYPELRVRDFLRFAGGIRDLSGKALDSAIERTVARFDLEPVLSRVIGNLSKGFQQRVSLAQGFLHDPSLVIVDEPTMGLDPVQQSEVRGVLADLRGRRTVLLCTHDLTEARELTSRVAVLYRGRLVAMGPTQDVLGGDDPYALFRGKAGLDTPADPAHPIAGRRS
jgi:ABC-2 type transport system ATP-binding protein